MDLISKARRESHDEGFNDGVRHGFHDGVKHASEQLEARIAALGERVRAQREALTALVAIVKRSGFMTPEEQLVLWQAEQLVAMGEP